MRTLVAALALAMAAPALAVPGQLTQQGRLLDNAGLPVTGNHDITVNIYDVASGGIALWSETQNVAFDEGYFAADLSGVDEVLFDGRVLYVGVQLDAGPEGPRQAIVSVPYALRANTAASVEGGVIDVQEVRIDGNTVIDDTGTFTGGLEGATLEGLTCVANQVALYDGTSWGCQTLSTSGGGGSTSWNDLTDVPVGFADGEDGGNELANIVCAPDQVVYWDPGFNQLGCRDDHVLSEQDVEDAITNGAIDLSGGTTIGGANLVTDWSNLPSIPADFTDGIDNDTLAGISCNSGEILRYNGSSWACSVLDEATVETWITNGPLDLDSGSTIGGTPVSTLTIADFAGQDLDVGNISVSGATQVGTTSVCGAGDEGTLRYTGGALEVCDGSGWVGVGSDDRTPDAFGFTAVTDATIGALTTSNTVTVQGFDGTLTAAAVGEGDPMVSVNGGAFAPAAAVSDGDSVTLRVTAPGSVSSMAATLVVGDRSATWDVSTAQDDATCATLLAAGNISDGTYTIDPDGPGGNDPFGVYCDMGAGGWTYAALNTPFLVEFTEQAQVIDAKVVDVTYDFTLYGGMGGRRSNGTNVGGQGGEATGLLATAAGTMLYAYVGGEGAMASREDQGSCFENWGGWNGGGVGSRGGSGGGGGTDIRTRLGDPASRLIVAGGGGGCGNGGCATNGGAGGGTTGGNGAAAASPPTGGTQSAGGTSSRPEAVGRFFWGGRSWPINDMCNDAGGGGGGWYGGGGAGQANQSGGGGSGYIGGVTAGTLTSGVNQGDGYIEYIFQ